MFKKVHLRLTLLFTLFSTLILLVMSFLYLYINYRTLDNNSYITFGTDMNTFQSAFENNSTDMRTVKRLQSNYSYLIFIYDNDIPLRITDVTKTDEERSLAERIREYNNSGEAGTTSDGKLVFTYREKSQKYYVGFFIFRGIGSNTEVYVVRDNSDIKTQKERLLARFVIIVAAAALVFYAFSYFFTKRLLRPINESQKRQNEFIAAASHEIRNPVNTILSALSAMEKAEPSQQQELVTIARKEGRRLARLTGDLLTLARSDAKTFTANFGTAELDTIILDCFEAFTPRAAEKNIRISVELPDDTVSAENVDSERIKQVIAILTDNAISYTPEGGTIKLSLETTPKENIIKVTDSGDGIPDDRKEKIFERFFRADDSRTDGSHFGLGLCIAKELVDLHSGSIFVTDAEGGGSTFTVILPISKQNT